MEKPLAIQKETKDNLISYGFHPHYDYTEDNCYSLDGGF